MSFSHPSMVGARGFEPPASRTRTVRSTRLSYAPFEGVSLNAARRRRPENTPASKRASTVPAERARTRGKSLPICPARSARMTAQPPRALPPRALGAAGVLRKSTGAWVGRDQTVADGLPPRASTRADAELSSLTWPSPAPTLPDQSSSASTSRRMTVTLSRPPRWFASSISALHASSSGRSSRIMRSISGSSIMVVRPSEQMR